MLVMFLIGTAEVVAGPMMAAMGAHFGVPAAQIAWLPASYALVYASLAPLLGPLSDRFGRKPLLVPGLIGFSAAAVLIALAPSFSSAVAAGIFGGICAAAVQPNALSIINDNVEEEAQPAATGRVFMGLTLSFVIMPVVSAVLAARVDWRAAYLLVGAAALVAAILTWRMPVRRAAVQNMGFWTTFREALTIYSVRRRLAASFLWLGLSIGVTTVLAEVLRRRFHMQTEAIGVMVGAFGLVTVIGNSLIGRTERLAGSRSRVVVGGVIATLIGCLVVGVLPPFSLPVAALAGVVWALGYGIAGPVHHSGLGQISRHVRGTITALNASLLNLGIVVVASCAGRFFDALGVEAVVGMAVLGMVSGLGLLLTIRPAPDLRASQPGALAAPPRFSRR
ncbi:MFS transporter [Sorangium sp. So ce834]|uniref:MFS transporter n=1 Tax=Sorangium sp. So ce834 TaxID=3133321 RepID=UPI003F5DE6EE